MALLWYNSTLWVIGTVHCCIQPNLPCSYTQREGAICSLFRCGPDVVVDKNLWWTSFFFVTYDNSLVVEHFFYHVIVTWWNLALVKGLHEKLVIINADSIFTHFYHFAQAASDEWWFTPKKIGSKRGLFSLLQDETSDRLKKCFIWLWLKGTIWLIFNWCKKKLRTTERSLLAQRRV